MCEVNLMNTQLVTVQRCGAAATLTVNRPEVLNAINSATLVALGKAIEKLEGDQVIRLVFVCGAGDAFVAGGDIREMRDLKECDARAFLQLGHRVLRMIERSSMIFIAVINGPALGGGTELALACDLRIAASDAQMGLPEVRIGLFPGWGGTQRLERLIGRGAAMRLILTGRRLSGVEAEHLGLVNAAVPRKELWNAAHELAEEVLKGAPAAVALAKRAIVQAGDTSLSAGLQMEMESWLVNFNHADRASGLTAFLAGQSPPWVHEGP